MDFDKKAEGWDTPLRTERAHNIANQIQKVVPSSDEMKALEFGCGTGLISFFLKDRYREITLVDSSKGMIEKLNTKIAENEIHNMKTVCTDVNIEDVLPHDSFDVIYTSMALHHIPDIEGTLDKLNRLLIKGGYLCIVDLDEDDGSFHKFEKDFNGHNGFNHEKLKGILEKYGYNFIKAETFYRDTKEENGEKFPYSLFIMTSVREDKSSKDILRYYREELKWNPPFADMLSKYMPGTLKGYLQMRQSIEEGSLDKKTKELIFCILDSLDDEESGAKAHAAAAIEAGMSMEELTEAFSIVTLVRGINTLCKTGIKALEAAEIKSNELKGGC